MNNVTDISHGRTLQQKDREEERRLRIRSSLERINRLMADLRHRGGVSGEDTGGGGQKNE